MKRKHVVSFFFAAALVFVFLAVPTPHSDAIVSESQGCKWLSIWCQFPATWEAYCVNVRCQYSVRLSLRNACQVRQSLPIAKYFINKSVR